MTILYLPVVASNGNLGGYQFAIGVKSTENNTEKEWPGCGKGNQIYRIGVVDQRTSWNI